MSPKVLPPDDPRAPKYWMHETSGVLKPVIEAYLNGEELNVQQISLLRAYLRQWIDSPCWRGPKIDPLRRQVRNLQTRDDIDHWLEQALEEGIDPL
jgi:hypothetical protein